MALFRPKQTLRNILHSILPGPRIKKTALLFALLSSGPVLPAFAAPDNLGTTFWLSFPFNLYQVVTNYMDVDQQLFITGPTAATGTVSIPGIGFSAPFAVTPGTITTIHIPNTAMLMGSDTVTSQGVFVTASQEVAVYGLSLEQVSSDSYTALPLDVLGTDYLVMTYRSGNDSIVAVTATQDGTAVTITPPVAVGARAAGVPYVVNMNQGQTYQLESADTAIGLLGTSISSSQPVAVFGADACGNVPFGVSYCDFMVEQMLPTSEWGKHFVTMPLATRLNGDTFVLLASTNNTHVQLTDATGTASVTLNRGQSYEQIVQGPAQITSDNPIEVSQFSNGTAYDNVNSDPFMMLIPSTEQFLSNYTVATPASGFSSNFLNVTVETPGTGSILLDGTAIPAASFTPIGTSGFSGVQIPIAVGSHTLSSALPFGVCVYGFDAFDSYGNSGGLSLAKIADVASLSLSPPTQPAQLIGNSQCVTATLLDSDSKPVTGVRVDFKDTGADPVTTSLYTDVSGKAFFCVVGAAAGKDNIQAAFGSLAATAVLNWNILTPTPTATFTPTITSTPTETPTPTCQTRLWPDPFTPLLAFNGTLKLDCIPLGSTVSFFTLSGEKVADVPESGLMAQWDGRNRLGNFVVSGAYYYVVAKGSQVSARGKFLVLRGNSP